MGETRTRQKTGWKDDRRTGRRDDLQHLATTFFFTNFPKDWLEKELWRMFNRFGVVVDVYLARKLNKVGKKFGFVRFIRVQNINKLEDELNKIWNGSYKLFVSVAKFRRKKVNELHLKDGFTRAESFRQTEVRSNKKKSYAEAIRGSIDTVNNKPEDDIAVSKSAIPSSKSFRISLESNDNIEVIEYLKDQFVAKAKSVQALVNLPELCSLEGCEDVKFKYLGGLWVLVQCHNNKRMELDGNDTGFSSWFHSIQKWSKEFVVEERLTWVNIEGVPVKVWNPNSFISIASKWGEVVISEPHWNSKTNFRVGKVCIITKNKQLISESEEILVDGKVVVIRITEGDCFLPPWESRSTAEEEDNSECGDTEDDDFSIGSVEGEEDPLFVADSFEDAESGTQNNLSNGLKKSNVGTSIRGSREKSPAEKQAGTSSQEKEIEESLVGSMHGTKNPGNVNGVNFSPSSQNNSERVKGGVDGPVIGMEDGLAYNAHVDEVEKSEIGPSLEPNVFSGPVSESPWDQVNKAKITTHTVTKRPKLVSLSDMSSQKSQTKIRKGRRRNLEEETMQDKEVEFEMAEDSDIIRCNSRHVRHSCSSPSLGHVSVLEEGLEIQKTIEVGEMLGLKMENLRNKLENNPRGQGMMNVDQ